MTNKFGDSFYSLQEFLVIFKLSLVQMKQDKAQVVQ